MSIHKISYWLNKKDYCDLNFNDMVMEYLKLFDLMGYNSNILMIFRRMSDEGKSIFNQLTKEISCDIVCDTERGDRELMCIEQLESNLILLDALSAMDEQTEWEYMPNIENFSTYISNYSKKGRREEKCENTFLIKISYDGDYGLHIFYDTQLEKLNHFKESLECWEHTLTINNISYKKKVKIKD